MAQMILFAIIIACWIAIVVNPVRRNLVFTPEVRNLLPLPYLALPALLSRPLPAFLLRPAPPPSEGVEQGKSTGRGRAGLYLRGGRAGLYLTSPRST